MQFRECKRFLVLDHPSLIVFLKLSLKQQIFFLKQLFIKPKRDTLFYPKKRYLVLSQLFFIICKDFITKTLNLNFLLGALITPSISLQYIPAYMKFKGRSRH